MGTKVREIAWPDEYSDLKRIEELMICGICYEYIDTSVITPCSHNYCSVCIRKYLHYKAQCPACFHVFFEKDLYINRAMDGLIQHYIKVREKLISLIENRVMYNTVVQQREQDPPNTPPVRPARNAELPKSPKTVEKQQSEPKTPTVNLALASTSRCTTSSPTARQSPKVIPSIAKIFNTPKRKEVVPPPVVNTKKVSCPVCRVDISQNHVNIHLDACLKREVAQETIKEKQKAPKRPPLPKLVLRVMKDAELRKKMKEMGLSTQGDRRTLENRFTRYSVIYNAECDKLEPRAISELIRQCEMEEKQERKMDSFLVSMAVTNRLQIERNAQEEKIEEAQKNYRTTNKSSFDKLIEEVKNRRRIEKTKQQSNDIISSNSTSVASTSTVSENTKTSWEEIQESSSTKESNHVNPSTSAAFQGADWDSDESCPLQHYRSDDPVSVLQNCNDSNSSFSGSPIKIPQNIVNQDNFKSVKLETSEVIVNNPYEMSTDESTDDDVPSSPILLNKNPIRKKVKLSNKSLNKSNSSLSTTLDTFDNERPIEIENQVTAARELCSSIIKDFSFDMLSDDSCNEFVDKPQPFVKGIEKIRHSKISNDNTLNQSELRNSIFCDKNVPENNANGDLKNGLNNSLDDFSFGILNGDGSSEILNTSILDFKEVQEQKINNTLKESIHINSTKIEKENDAFSANENSQPSHTEGIVRRPLRKRNRPSRFTEDETAKQNEKGKTRKELSEDSKSNEMPDGINNGVLSDGSLKRRRGRPKTPANHPSDELQNPPKRPVRRRQLVSDRAHC